MGVGRFHYKPRLQAKWIYERSFFWTAEKDVKTCMTDQRGYVHNLSSCENRAQAWTGFEPMTSAIPVQCSTNWAINLLTWSRCELVIHRCMIVHVLAIILRHLRRMILRTQRMRRRSEDNIIWCIHVPVNMTVLPLDLPHSSMKCTTSPYRKEGCPANTTHGVLKQPLNPSVNTMK